MLLRKNSKNFPIFVLLLFASIFFEFTSVVVAEKGEVSPAKEYFNNENDPDSIAAKQEIDRSATPSTLAGVEIVSTIVSPLVSDVTKNISDVFSDISKNVPEAILHDDRKLLFTVSPVIKSLSSNTTGDDAPPIFDPETSTSSSIFENSTTTILRDVITIENRTTTTAESAIDRYVGENSTTAITNETGKYESMENENFTSPMENERFVIPANFSQHETVESSNITEPRTSGFSNTSDSVPLSMNDSKSNESTATQIDFPVPPTFASGNSTSADFGTNSTESMTSGFDSPNSSSGSTQSPTIPIPFFDDFNNSTNTTSSESPSSHGNESIASNLPTSTLFSNFSSTISNQSDSNRSSDLETSTMVPAISATFSHEFDDWSTEVDAMSQGNNETCWHRSSNHLEPSEIEHVVTLRLVKMELEKWNNKSEALICRFLLRKLCHRSEEGRNDTNCVDLRLEIIDEPTLVSDDLLIHFLTGGSKGNSMDGRDELSAILSTFDNEIGMMLASVWSENTTTTSQYYRTDQSSVAWPPTSTRAYEHPLDNPVIATSLIAVVVTVCLVAMLSLLILVLLQRRRRSRKGEWIVNRKDRSLNGGTQQAYGWCFENDAFAASKDEKTVPPPPPARGQVQKRISAPLQLLDDRGQRLTLPVDDGAPVVMSAATVFEMTTTSTLDGRHDSYPVALPPPPPPPPLPPSIQPGTQLNTFDNGYHRRSEQLSSSGSPPTPSQSMEMLETKGERWY